MTDYKPLIQNLSDVEEVWEEVSRYLVYRGGREISLVVLDRGPEYPQTRFMATAEATDIESGEIIRGQSNSEADVDEAIYGVHWQNFD